jgi:N-acetylneuraminate synthase
MNIGGVEVGDGHPCYIVAEIGINHNGSVEQAIQLIQAAKEAGCNAVKFQKRTVDIVYSLEERMRPRESVFGNTNGDLKRGLEFGMDEYRAIDAYCKLVGMPWFASCWDEYAVVFMDAFDVPCYKVASASLTDDILLSFTRYHKMPILLSTGMSTLEQIDHAVDVLGKDDLILLHCCSAYPAYNNELNLRAIPALRQRYGVPVGYSGHELELSSTVAAVALGACVVERHITLSRELWGSDQAASLEPHELKELVRDIRFVESALGDGQKRVMEREIPVMNKLRRQRENQ